MTYLNIFGSQLRALNDLNNRALSIEELRHYFHEGLLTVPESFRSRTFEQWLLFLGGNKLILQEGNTVKITLLGREFLKYLVQRGHDMNRLG